MQLATFQIILYLENKNVGAGEGTHRCILRIYTMWYKHSATREMMLINPDHQAAECHVVAGLVIHGISSG